MNFSEMTVRRLESLATQYKPSDEMDELLKLKQSNLTNFNTSVSAAERIKVGHYLNAKTAREELERREKLARQREAARANAAT